MVRNSKGTVTKLIVKCALVSSCDQFNRTYIQILKGFETELIVVCKSFCLLATVAFVQTIVMQKREEEAENLFRVGKKNIQILIIMARASGNINANGSISSDTSNKNGWTLSRPFGDNSGKYRITFDQAFKESPSVFVTIINFDAENPASQPAIGVIVNSAYTEIEFYENNAYPTFSFSFAAFGDV